MCVAAGNRSHAVLSRVPSTVPVHIHKLASLTVSPADQAGFMHLQKGNTCRLCADLNRIAGHS
jgi:hypothetical protein